MSDAEAVRDENMQFVGKPTLGFSTRGEAVMALAGEGLSISEIARRVGTNRKAVSCLLRHVRRKHGYQGYYRTEFTVAAKARGITVQELELRLLDIIARHGLVDAILDDRQEAAE